MFNRKGWIAKGSKGKKEPGNVGDLLAAGICMLAMTILVLSYFDSVSLIYQKASLGQIARKYILRMETYGGLTEDDEIALLQELSDIEITDVTLDGTSMSAEYGEMITLVINGKIKGEYQVEEKRVSTAKN